MNFEIIKNFISNTVFKSKKLDAGIMQALSIAAGIEDHNGRNTCQAIKDITENTPDEVYNNLLPLSVKPGKKAAADVLFDFISKSDSRLALTGVYSDKERGLYSATDTKYMAIAPMPDAVKNSLEKSIIKDKNGNEVKAVYPNYFNVIPQNCRNSVKLDSLYLYAGFVGSLCNFNACFFDNPNRTPVNISGVEFRADLLLNALQAFCKCGCNFVTMEYNTPECPVMFTAANGLKVIAMPLRGKGGYSFPVCARVNVLTDDAQFHNFSLDHRKINAGGNDFFGTCKNPLYLMEFAISQAEIEKLDDNIRKNYRDIISRIANGAVNLVYDPKIKNLDGLNISGYLKECNYTVASERTAAEHKFFIETVKNIKTPDDCKKALPVLLEWMRIINDYVENLVNKGYSSEYRQGIAKFQVEYYEKLIFDACQKNIADKKITLEYAENLFYGGRERYNAIAELVNNANAELDKKEKEMQAANPADAEKTQNNAVTSDIKPDAVNYTPEQSNAAGTSENNEKQDTELDNLPYWNKARELCTVSSGTLANLLNCDKYSVIERVEYEWQEYIARNGTTADNWQECWQEFQQSEEYNYLALIHGLPLPPPDDITPFNACARAYEHTDCPPDKSNVAIPCTQAGIHTDQHRQCSGIANIAVPAAVPDG